MFPDRVVCSFDVERVLRQAYASHDQNNLTTVNTDTIYSHVEHHFTGFPTQYM
jgi:GTP cyclohydrolase I